MNKRFLLSGLLLIILLIVGTLTFTQQSSSELSRDSLNNIASSTQATTTPTTGATDNQPVPNNYIVDQSRNNKTFTLKVGDEFLLSLDKNIDWKVTFSKPHIVEQLKTTEVLQGTQGIFKAQKVGETTLSAGGGVHCEPNESCILLYSEFTVHIVVEE